MPFLKPQDLEAEKKIITGLDNCAVSCEDDTAFERCKPCPWDCEGIDVSDCRAVLSKCARELLTKYKTFADRAVILLKASHDILNEAQWELEKPVTAVWDDTECDLFCLMDEIRTILEDTGIDIDA